MLCYYPEPEQSVRRAPKTTIADVSARLARLERTISALFNDPTTNQGVIPPAGRPVIENFNSLDISTPSVESAASEEKLVQGDTSSRYYNEALISRVLEEVYLYHLHFKTRFLTSLTGTRNQELDRESA